MRTRSHRAADRESSRRAGMTLLDVLLSIVILGMAWAGISQVTSNGMMLGLRVQHDGEAAVRCESKLHEFVSGIEPLRQTHDEAFDDDPNWRWSAQVTYPMADLPELALVAVTVAPVSGNLTDSSCTLQRLVRPKSGVDGGSSR